MEVGEGLDVLDVGAPGRGSGGPSRRQIGSDFGVANKPPATAVSQQLWGRLTLGRQPRSV